MARLRLFGIAALLVLDGPISRPAFRTQVDQGGGPNARPATSG
ncbi:hypothetical protein F8B43_0852 [Methylorubrum populi]|uniref:Uncharacterized protein n=1 Tax=Methylorubrum populi TaxID=223967 RepID=A0A833J943_9HYPH|nr:hypothetical protein F8B43_0852 [Methylorubrum populi]